MEASCTYFPNNRLRVCVDQWEDEKVSGRVYAVSQKEATVFRDLAELLLKMDDLFDVQGHPQSFQDKRSFREDNRPSRFSLINTRQLSSEQMMNFNGELATFDVTVKSRRNATWQGDVRRPEGQILEEFGEAIRLGEIFEKYI